jgi:ribosomal protein L11 methyltransferase
LLRAFFDREEPVADACRRLSWCAAEYGPEPELDYVQLYQDSWHPAIVGSRLYITPSWRDEPTPAGRVRIEIDPGLACGTGDHPTTRLCLEELERWVTSQTTVLDLGTGSGILAVAAARLGAKSVVACDIDGTAVDVARRNFVKAGVSPRLFQGSLRSVRRSSVDLLVANISAAGLSSLWTELMGVVRPEGRVILSGFYQADAARIAGRLPGAQVRETGGWACVISLVDDVNLPSR